MRCHYQTLRSCHCLSYSRGRLPVLAALRGERVIQNEESILDFGVCPLQSLVRTTENGHWQKSLSIAGRYESNYDRTASLHKDPRGKSVSGIAYFGYQTGNERFDQPSSPTERRLRNFAGDSNTLQRQGRFEQQRSRRASLLSVING